MVWPVLYYVDILDELFLTCLLGAVCSVCPSPSDRYTSSKNEWCVHEVISKQ